MSCYTYLYILLPIEVRSALRGAKPDGGLGADFFLRFFRLPSPFFFFLFSSSNCLRILWKWTNTRLLRHLHNIRIYLNRLCYFYLTIYPSPRPDSLLQHRILTVIGKEKLPLTPFGRLIGS